MPGLKRLGLMILVLFGPGLLIYFIAKTVSNKFVEVPYIGEHTYTYDAEGNIVSEHESEDEAKAALSNKKDDEDDEVDEGIRIRIIPKRVVKKPSIPGTMTGKVVST